MVDWKWHHIVLAPCTKSGVNNQVWMYCLLGIYQESCIAKGPLFRATVNDQRLATIKELDILFHQYLVMVQEQRPDLISPSINVWKDYSVRRSL